VYAPAISDGAHAPGNSGFFLLPPIVANPAYTGVFDPNLSPEVQVCRFGVSACDGAPIAVYTTTTGPGSETVRVGSSNDHYIVNWNTGLYSIAEGSTYRISVLLGTTVLGYADVQIFPTAKAAKSAQSNDYVNLVDGRTLPIKFRIEQGTVVAVTVFPSPATVIRGRSAILTATLTDAHGNVVTGLPITWSSAAQSIASVDANGAVTGVAVGITSVSATVNGYSGSAQVIVIPPPVASITVTPSSATVIVSKTRQLAAEVKDADGNVLTDRVVTWTSSDNGIATVDANGLVTAVSPGNVTITATCEGISSTAAITVIVPPVASVVVTPDPASVIIGKTVQLIATVRDADGNVLTGRVVTWSSADGSIAIIDANGLVTGVHAGTVTVTATSEGITGSAQVIVQLPPAASVVVTPNPASVMTGGTVQLIATVRDADGNVLTNRAVSWHSGNVVIAAVNGVGLVTGTLEGSTTVTATSEGITGSALVIVQPPPVDSVVVMPNPASVTTGGTVQLTATVRDADGNALIGRAVSWQSSNPSVATVDANGLVTGVTPGTITVSATSEGGKRRSQVNVTAAGLFLASLTAGARVTSCGLDVGGSAYCWGNGTPRPVALNWGFPLKQLSISLFMTCGLAMDGTAYCKGEYVSGHYPKSTTPTAVPAPVKFVQLTEHGFAGPTCGLATDGTAWCWGYFDAYGSQAYQISSTVRFVSILGGEGNNCGLTANYELWCWGPFLSGGISVAVRIQSGHQFKYVTVSGSSCGLDLDSYVWCWGINDDGEFGNGSTAFTGQDWKDWSGPAVLGMNGMRFKSIHVGSGKMCGIALDDGAAYCSGRAYIGDGTSAGSLFPRRINSPEPLVEVVPSELGHVCGLTATGAVYCWGENSVGEVGNGTFTTPILTPVRVIRPLP
jgi:uncharacterized protein YjdB